MKYILIRFFGLSNKFKQYLDIVFYMRKMQEIDILKYLLLDKNMMQLVNFISKPNVGRNESVFSKNKIYFEYQNADYENPEDIKNLKEGYERILSKNSDEKINKRLIKLCEDQIKYI